MDTKDSFRELAFDGKPSNYRDFRRRVILSVAALEDKSQHLAGPKLMTRLSGEAWRAVEHLSIAELRCPEGWLTVLTTLDKHYKHLPELELHEAIDEFMFGLKRKNHESATAFASRFKTTLNRLEVLIAQERATRRSRKRKKGAGSAASESDQAVSEEEANPVSVRGRNPSAPPTPRQVDAETDNTDDQEEVEPVRVELPGPFDPPLSPKRSPAGSVHSSKPSSKSKQLSTGTHSGDQWKQWLKMQRLLGTLEESHTTPKAILPESVLGHLFMRKYGLSRDARAHLIRSTGGSSRFKDIEKLMRASEFEDPRHEDRRPPKHRREAYAVALGDGEASSSIEEPLSSSEGEALNVEDGETAQLNTSSEEELNDVYEIQRRAKKDAKKNIRTYKESKKRVKEIKKNRQPYLPVVALQQQQGETAAGSASSQAPSTARKYEKKTFDKRGAKDRDKGRKPPQKQDAHLADVSFVTEFSYAVQEEESSVLIASIPIGCGLLDTGCTTSVIGRRTAERYKIFFKQKGFPSPEVVTLPPVVLRGFAGQTQKSTEGWKWPVKLGELFGSIVTYVVDGDTPFLLSRQVLESMGAVIDTGNATLTSVKHGMHEAPLRRASNGHFLLPLHPEVSELDVQQVSIAHDVPQEMSEHNQNEPNMNRPEHEWMDQAAGDEQSVPETGHSSALEEVNPQTEHLEEQPPRVLSQGPKVPKTKPTRLDVRRAFQHVAKNTKNGIVDLGSFQDETNLIFDCENSGQICHVFVAYRPRLERIPKDADKTDYECAVAILNKDGTFHRSEWQHRAANAVKSKVGPADMALFAFRTPKSEEPADSCPEVHRLDEEEEHEVSLTQPGTFDEETDHEVSLNQSAVPDTSLETLYEETDWLDVDMKPVPQKSALVLEKSLRSVTRLGHRLTLSRLQSDKAKVEQELKEWLGPQAYKLQERVGLIEVFTGEAPLSDKFERFSNKHAIRIGYAHGQDLDQLKQTRLLLLLIAYCRPDHVWISFPCTHWGPWSRLNMSKSDLLKCKIESSRAFAKRQLHLVEEVWHLQKALGGHCHAENPLTSDAWKELSLGEAWTTRIDECALDLRSPRSNLPIMKPTRIVSTQETMVKALVWYRCDGKHEHDHLEGSYRGKSMTTWAETCPEKMARVIAEIMCKGLRTRKPPKLEDVFADNDEDTWDYGLPDIEESIDPAQMPAAAPAPEPEVPELTDMPEPVNRSSREVEPSVALNPRQVRNEILIRKLHVNTGHASVEQMLRLANRCQASPDLIQTIKSFRCEICDEMKPSRLHRPSAVTHAEQPNQIVGVDYVQVELKREDHRGRLVEKKFNVLTCVDLATSFAQQIVVRPGPNQMSKAFHEVWTRPFGAPKIVFADPHNMTLSMDFQQYLSDHDIVLLHCATESHYQLGQVEIANRVLRGMAQRCWITTNRPPEECIETCCTVRNDQLRKSGFSPAQWFLGRSPRLAGLLRDVDEQTSFVNQTKYFSDPSFNEKVNLMEEAAKAFQAEHAKDSWRRAVAARTRPIRGPYVQGQLVYMFRVRGRGQLSTRHGRWLGPGIVIGTESSTGGVIPRIVWVSYNGFLYRCSPEGLRPVATDEHAFRQLAKELTSGAESAVFREAREMIADKPGRFRDLTGDVPQDSDHELEEDLKDEPDDSDFSDGDPPDYGKAVRNPIRAAKKQAAPEAHSEGVPRKIARRFYRSPEYWEGRARGDPPRGALHEGDMPVVRTSMEEVTPEDIQPPSKRLRFDSASPEAMEDDERYTPSLASPRFNEDNQPENDDYSPEPAYEAPTRDSPPNENMESGDPEGQQNGVVPDAEEPAEVIHEDEPMPDGVDVPVPEDDELAIEAMNNRMNQQQDVLEVALDVGAEDVTENPLCLWAVLEEVLTVVPKAKQRRVEVSFRKLAPADKERFLQAMRKEWNSWIENKVTSLCKARGIPEERIIRARWVLVWKKSSDPDDKTKTPKARLVLVGWQDPELGQIATDAPTLRKETKHLVLSVCAAKSWQLWGADIKTAFLSGDQSCRDIYFRPPPEVKDWMNLDNDDLMRLEKAAYGLAEAPRAWFMRLTRELRQSGLSQSQLGPCLWYLRRNGQLLGVCGIHVDDLLGGGTKEMTAALNDLKTRLPFGDFRTFTIRYTGIEVRQDPNTMCIEIGQESYIDALESPCQRNLLELQAPPSRIPQY